MNDNTERKIAAGLGKEAQGCAAQGEGRSRIAGTVRRWHQPAGHAALSSFCMATASRDHMVGLIDIVAAAAAQALSSGD